MMNLSEKDKQQIKSKGLTIVDIEKQVENFKNGFPPMDLVKPATINDGIMKFTDNEIDGYQKMFIRKSPDYYLLKFIPASGAASRMFKFLFEYLNDPSKNEKEIEKFIQHIGDFAFFEDLKKVMKERGYNIDREMEKGNYSIIIETLLNPSGLNYSNLPKALIKFHKYMDGSRTPIEEHLVEGADYAINVGNIVNLHFTISKEHEELFNEKVDQVKEHFSNTLGAEFKVEHSFQKEYTDIVAVDMDNNLFRNNDGSLLFRPGGHGALLENLNNLDADLVFIKNIDNVVPDSLKDTTNTYKKALAGLLINTQQKIFEYLRLIDKSEEISEEKLNEIAGFIESFLSVKPPEHIQNADKRVKVSYLFNILNRPLRVCGMVKNEGEPGGGPFWVREKDGRISLQIVEMAQIDTNEPKQREIVNNSSHFNPVDLVCGLKDYKGKKFELTEYRDPTTGIISKKSKDGKDLKAQELPGLWNGAMAFWNTIFVEVPLITFNPVKTVNDLLRKEHQ